MKLFCLESEWSETDLKDRSSVISYLSYLENVLGKNSFEYIHRRTPTLDSFHYYLNEFSKRKYKMYDVLYLAMHGSEGTIHFAGNSELSLEEFANLYAGKLPNTYLHFGACSTLALSEKELLNFKRKTGIKHLSGYKRDVDFIESSMLEIGLFSWLAEYERRGHIGERILKDYPSLVKRLGFVFV